MLGDKVVERAVVHGEDLVEKGKGKGTVEAVAITLGPADADEASMLLEPVDLAEEAIVALVFLFEIFDGLYARDEGLVAGLLIPQLLGELHALSICESVESEGWIEASDLSVSLNGNRCQGAGRDAAAGLSRLTLCRR